MAKFHISPDGVARRCNAGKGENARGCRYHIPDEQHYTTKEDAIKGAEQQLDKENGGSFGKKRAKNIKENSVKTEENVSENKYANVSKTELNNLIKSAGADQELLMAGAESGSPRIMNNVLTNNFAGSEVVDKLYDNYSKAGKFNDDVRNKMLKSQTISPETLLKMETQEFNNIPEVRKPYGISDEDFEKNKHIYQDKIREKRLNNVRDHTNYPIENLSSEEFKDRVARANPYAGSKYGLSRISHKDSINNEMAQTIVDRVNNIPNMNLDIKRSIVSPLVLNKDNKVSKQIKEEIMNGDERIKVYAMRQGIISPHRMHELSHFDLVAANNDKNFNEALANEAMSKEKIAETREAAKNTYRQHPINSLANNENIHSTTISNIIKKDPEIGRVFYDNPNITRQGKQALETRFKDLAIKGRTDRIVKQFGNTSDFIKSMQKTDSKINKTNYNQSRTYGGETISFDPQKLKDNGVDKEDLMNIMKGRYNAGVNYNEETGEFTGRIDSSD